VFARAKAHQLRKEPEKGRALLTPEECEEFLKEGKPFQFDLYRIPYNEGRGGKAEPLEGAAANGFSNFFPKYSPDGQWIIFCRARNYMLLQPDSELYIIPARGGPARRLAGNTGRMNSWHSWSPNGRWLVFASKAYSPYTQLCLTHLDEQGNSSPAVRLSRLVAPGRAANIPEFVSLPPAAIQHIEARFLNDYSHARAGYVCERTGDFDAAIKEYRQALALNPQNPHAHERLGYVLYHHQRDPQQGLKHCREAVRLAPRNGQARFILGTALFNQNQVREAVDQLAAALELFPATPAADPQYNLAELHRRLGLAQLLAEDYPASAQSLAEAVRLKLEDPELRFSLAVALAHQGFIEEPLEQYLKAVALSPQMGRLPQLYDLLGANCAKAGRYAEAIDFAEKALRRARDANRADLAAEFGRRLAAYKEKLAKP
jgi:tetratricopeptide (TPR) repeat protein